MDEYDWFLWDMWTGEGNVHDAERGEREVEEEAAEPPEPESETKA